MKERVESHFLPSFSPSINVLYEHAAESGQLKMDGWMDGRVKPKKKLNAGQERKCTKRPDLLRLLSKVGG